MTVPDSARYIWRHDRTGAVSRADARAYLSLLVELGYQPTPIEQAITDGLPYRGDAPSEEPAPDAGAPSQEPGTGEDGGFEATDADAWVDPETDHDTQPYPSAA
jgi:ParB family chromosome partitioning protein